MKQSYAYFGRIFFLLTPIVINLVLIGVARADARDLSLLFFQNILKNAVEYEEEISSEKASNRNIITINVTPDFMSWTLTGPEEFEGNGVVYTGDQIFRNVPAGVYTWTGIDREGYTTPAVVNLNVNVDSIITLYRTWITYGGYPGCTADEQFARGNLPGSADLMAVGCFWGSLALVGLTRKR